MRAPRRTCAPSAPRSRKIRAQALLSAKRRGKGGGEPALVEGMRSRLLERSRRTRTVRMQSRGPPVAARAHRIESGSGAHGRVTSGPARIWWPCSSSTPTWGAHEAFPPSSSDASHARGRGRGGPASPGRRGMVPTSQARGAADEHREVSDQAVADHAGQVWAGKPSTICVSRHVFAPSPGGYSQYWPRPADVAQGRRLRRFGVDRRGRRPL